MMKMGEKMRKNLSENRCWMAMKMMPTSPNATIRALSKGPCTRLTSLLFLSAWRILLGLGAACSRCFGTLQILYLCQHPTIIILQQMEISKQLKKLCLSEHKEQSRRTSFNKFKIIQTEKDRHRSIESTGSFSCVNDSMKESDRVEEQREYNNLSRKLEEKRKMMVGTRNFNKSFYSKLAKKIADKPVSFYKFGLKQEEKRTCKAVFTQLFKIPSQKLKGSLSIGQLWDNKTSMKYLKQNQMFFNKEILIQQFQSIDKEQKQRKRALEIERQREFVKKYREMVEENRKLNQNNIHYQEVRDMDARDACSFIRSEIDKLVEGRDRKELRVKASSRKIIAGLQRDTDKFDQIAWRFKNNMMVLL